MSPFFPTQFPTKEAHISAFNKLGRPETQITENISLFSTSPHFFLVVLAVEKTEKDEWKTDRSLLCEKRLSHLDMAFYKTIYLT